MKLPVFSFTAIVVFLLAALGMTFGSKMISRETFLHNYRIKFHIEPTTSTDGVFATKLCAHTPTLGGKVWIPNHARTLRALLVLDARSNESIIYIEQAQPRMCYELHGGSVLQNANEIYWMSPKIIGLIMSASGTQPIEYLIDVQTLSSTHHLFVDDNQVHQKQVGALYVD